MLCLRRPQVFERVRRVPRFAQTAFEWNHGGLYHLVPVTWLIGAFPSSNQILRRMLFNSVFYRQLNIAVQYNQRFSTQQRQCNPSEYARYRCTTQYRQVPCKEQQRWRRARFLSIAHRHFRSKYISAFFLMPVQQAPSWQETKCGNQICKYECNRSLQNANRWKQSHVETHQREESNWATEAVYFDPAHIFRVHEPTVALTKEERNWG